MKIKIEKKGLVKFGTNGNAIDWADFLKAVRTCKVGESFLMDRCTSQHRLALSIARHLLDVNFRAVTEETGVRIGRVG